MYQRPAAHGNVKIYYYNTTLSTPADIPYISPETTGSCCTTPDSYEISLRRRGFDYCLLRTLALGTSCPVTPDTLSHQH